MKWLLLLFSLFAKPLSRFNPQHLNPATEIKQFIVDNAKKVLLAITVTSVISSLFVAGLVITVITMSAQYDQNAGIGLSAMLLGGLGMMGLSLIIGWIVFSPTRETKEIEQEMRETPKVSSGSALTDALVLLVHDFIKEREFRRSRTGEYPHIERPTQYESIRDQRRDVRRERRQERREERRAERREQREEEMVGATPEESYLGYKDTGIRH